MLIDDLMPRYDVSEYHEILVHSSVERAFSGILLADFSANRLVRFLLGLRALPARMLGRGARRSFPSALTIEGAERFGFFVCAENPPAEIVIALQGKFWTVSGGTECASRKALDEPIAPGTARAVWSFSVRAVGESRCILATETRVQCADAHARRRFRVYWLFVRPGSGIIRRMMLRTIRRVAETR